MSAGLRLILCGALVPSALAADESVEPISFSASIAPLLLENCQGCHGAKKSEGSYRVDTFELSTGEGDSGAVGFVAGSIDDSEALRRVLSDDVSERMPLDRDALSAEQIELLRRWVAEGAKFDGENSQVALLL